MKRRANASFEPLNPHRTLSRLTMGAQTLTSWVSPESPSAPPRDSAGKAETKFENQKTGSGDPAGIRISRSGCAERTQSGTAARARRGRRRARRFIAGGGGGWAALHGVAGCRHAGCGRVSRLRRSRAGGFTERAPSVPGCFHSINMADMTSDIGRSTVSRRERPPEQTNSGEPSETMVQQGTERHFRPMTVLDEVCRLPRRFEEQGLRNSKDVL